MRKFKGLTARAKNTSLIVLICLCTLFFICWQYCNRSNCVQVSLGRPIQCHTYKEEWSVQYIAAVDLGGKFSTEEQISSPRTENDKRVASGIFDYSNNNISETKADMEPIRANKVTHNERMNVGHSTVTIPIKQSIKDDMKKCSLALGVSAGTVERYDRRMDKIAAKASIFLDTFWQIIPRNFIPSLKNPCWYSNLTVSPQIANTLASKLDQGKSVLSGRDLKWLSSQLFGSGSKHQRSMEKLHCLPYFLLAGFAKSGTTTLHSLLLRHSNIASPEVKEPHWWTRTPLGPMDHDFLKIAVVRYLINFLSASRTIELNFPLQQIITYDASSSLLPDSMFKVEEIDFCAMVSVISRVLPNVKVIVLIRDPVSRAYSQFYYMHGPFSKWPQEMKENASLYFHNYTSLAVNDFYDCLSQNKSDYECVHGVTTGRKELNTWIGLGVYYIHIVKWMQFFPRENFLFLKTDELSRDSRGVINKVTNFLGLNPSSESTARMLFPMKKNARRSFLNDKRYEMMAETKSLLKAFYSPYNAKLANIIGIKPI